MYYIIDTNIWIDQRDGILSCDDLHRTRARVVVAPFMIMELMRATVKGGEQYFSQNRHMFECISKFEILELTKGFLFKILWNVGYEAFDVRPTHYRWLIGSLVESDSLSDFLKKTERPGSSWKETANWDSIHERIVDKELRTLGKMAKGDNLKTFHTRLARAYGLGGLFPDPSAVQLALSAAIEFVTSSAIKIRNGANLLKNDRGLYIDSQLFYYLADPEAVVVSNERFSEEIRVSPQKTRIISYEQFRCL
jgi:hypothetical protein